jgi:PAS domain S-box-containing protein
VFRRGDCEEAAVLANRIATAVDGSRSTAAHERVYQALETATEGIGILDDDGRYIYMNREYADLYGHSPSDMEGEHWEQLYPDDEVERFRNDVLPALRASGRWRGRSRGIRADGSTFPQELSLTDLSGGGHVCVVRDVSEREHRERRFETLIQNMPGMVYRCENERGWPMTDVRGDVESFTGYTAPELEAAPRLWGESIVHPADRETLWSRIQAAVDDDEPFEATYRVRTKDGNTRWVWERGRAVSGPDHSSAMLEGVVTDITERKARERDRRQNERRFQATFNDPNILVGLLETDGTVSAVNDTAMSYIDAEEASVVGDRFWNTDWWRPETRDELRDWIRRAAAGEYVEYEADHLRSGADTFAVEGVIRPVTDDDGDVTSLLVTASDVTERRRHERELRWKTEAMEAAPVGIVLTDPDRPDNPITYANEHFTSLTGYSRTETEGRNCRFLQGAKTNEEPVERMRSAIADATSTTVELRNYRDSGAEFWNRVRIAPVRDDDGECNHFVGFQTDVTDRKIKERRLEVLNRILSHNLRNEMTVICGHLDLLRERLESPPAAVDKIESAVASLQRLAEKGKVIDRVLSATAGEPVAVEDHVEGLLEEFRERYPETNTEYSPPETATDAVAVPGLRRAIAEALENAIEHGRQHDAPVRIQVRDGSDDWAYVHVHDDNQPIPAQELAAIRGGETSLRHGDRLGLWLMHWVVSQAGGKVEIDSEETGNRLTLAVPTE